MKWFKVRGLWHTLRIWQSPKPLDTQIVFVCGVEVGPEELEAIYAGPMDVGKDRVCLGCKG